MDRGERPIKPSDSWFSPKCIWVQPRVFHIGGRALFGLGGLQAYRTQANSEYRCAKRGSETASDKVRSREGNSPDRQLRSLSLAKWETMSICSDSQEVGLEAATL